MEVKTMGKGQTIKRGNGNDFYLDTYIDLMKSEGRNMPSIQQYTCRVGQLASYIKKDLFSITSDELENWLKQGNDFKRNHVNSFFKTMLVCNVRNFQDIIDRSMLLYLAMN
jgi:hypothetical protein